jgi:hypothetical protein
MGSQSLQPFDFALSKIPTSRAKDAREMGHPAAFQASLPDAVRFWRTLTRQWNWRAIVGRPSGTEGSRLPGPQRLISPRLSARLEVVPFPICSRLARIGCWVAHLWRSLRKVGFHERKSMGILILDTGSQSPHPFGFAQGRLSFSQRVREEGWGIQNNQNRTKIKGDGQECPSHTFSVHVPCSHCPIFRVRCERWDSTSVSPLGF